MPSMSLPEAVKTSTGKTIALMLLASAMTACAQDTALKIAIIGDSTVSEYPEKAQLRGWGQALPQFFRADVLFFNEAKSGASTKTFPPDRWSKIIDLKPNYVLIEFGFNDQHEKTKPEATDAATDFKDNLRRYISEARQAGITPVLVTPNHRRIFDSQNRVTRELEPYVISMKEVGRETNVSVVDLYERSGKMYEALGEEGSTNFTVNKKDNADRPGRGDRTHFTAEGAREMARLVATGLSEVDPQLKASMPSDH